MKNIEITFLFCNWYSGGTLFSIILNNSSEIVCNGETFPWDDDGMDNDCSCGESILKCPFYSYCASEMKKENGNYDLSVFRVLPKFSSIKIINRYLNSFSLSPKIKKYILKSQPVWNSKLKYFINCHIKFIEKAIEIEGKKIYVDGTKNIRRAELLSQTENLNVRVIHLIRDGRGFCNSWIKNRSANKEKGLKIAARDWNNYITRVDTFSKRYPDIPVLTLKYEDLCTDLYLQYSKITNFLDTSGKWHKECGNPFHILGNRMRRSFNGKIKQDLSWQTELDLDDIKVIESIMKDQMERYGYI